MTLRPYRAYLAIVAMLALAVIPLRRADVVRYDEEPGVSTRLPDRIGSWTGEAVRFCPNPDCAEGKTTPITGNLTNCPACGQPLDDMEPFERTLLPRDTFVRRMQYKAPNGDLIMASLVLSGRERASIHRPEVCLSGAGSEIIASETLEVSLPGRAPLSIRLLTRRLTRGERVVYTYFAYWFVAKGRETPSHYQRMAWMAEDRIFRGLTRRWAYISIAGVLTSDRDADRAALRSFVRDLYPQL